MYVFHTDAQEGLSCCTISQDCMRLDNRVSGLILYRQRLVCGTYGLSRVASGVINGP